MSLKKISSRYPGARILIADDQPINLEFVKEVLELMECEVDIAGGGQEAIDMYEKKEYCLVLLDIMMPDVNGYDVASVIRASEKENSKASSHLPIVAVTAYSQDENKNKCFEIGMDDFIEKPLRTDHLEAVLQRYCILP